MQRVIVSVTNDLVTDQRVHKVCNTLIGMGFGIYLIGRKLPDSMPIERNYETFRMKLLFNNGFMFYAEYNIRLFFKLFFLKKDVLLSNDLDTLLPNFLISKIFSKKLVYDSHELFTEVPELIDRPRIQNTWLSIEKFIFPRLKNVYTVNASIASIYKKKYNVDVEIIRNIAPLFHNKSLDIVLSKKVKGTKKMLILQGSGINIDRGAEEAVTMMQYLENTVLYIIGSGDVFDKLKELVKTLKLEDKVFIKNRMSYQQLMEYTKISDLGLSLDKGTNLNYEYSLPNKAFDYIQAKTPLLVSNRKEIASLVLDNNIGLVVENLDPEKLAQVIKNLFIDQGLLKEWQENLVKAQKRYNWEKESEKLKQVFLNLG